MQGLPLVIDTSGFDQPRSRAPRDCTTEYHHSSLKGQPCHCIDDVDTFSLELQNIDDTHRRKCHPAVPPGALPILTASTVTPAQQSRPRCSISTTFLLLRLCASYSHAKCILSVGLPRPETVSSVVTCHLLLMSCCHRSMASTGRHSLSLSSEWSCVTAGTNSQRLSILHGVMPGKRLRRLCPPDEPPDSDVAALWRRDHSSHIESSTHTLWGSRINTPLRQ